MIEIITINEIIERQTISTSHSVANNHRIQMASSLLIKGAGNSAVVPACLKPTFGQFIEDLSGGIDTPTKSDLV